MTVLMVGATGQYAGQVLPALTAHGASVRAMVSAPGMVDRVELAAIISRVLGPTIEAAEPTFEEWADAAGLKPGPRRDGMRAMYDDYDRFGFPGGNALVLTAILNRAPRTLVAFFENLATKSSK